MFSIKPASGIFLSEKQKKELDSALPACLDSHGRYSFQQFKISNASYRNCIYLAQSAGWLQTNTSAEKSSVNEKDGTINSKNTRKMTL